MLKQWTTILAFLFLGYPLFAQETRNDSAIVPLKQADSSAIHLKQKMAIDTNINYEELFNDLDAFMDSILMPHSYFLVSLSVNKGYFNFLSKGEQLPEATQKLIYSPVIGYYHKSGFGITATGYIVNDEKNLNFYQFSLSPSYDYLENRDLATGIAYTRFFTKDSLPFYTSPLQNELYAYFTYRKWWIRPTVSASYGWGSRSAYTQREALIQSLRLRPYGYTYINNTESVSDFSVTTSVRHDFYWLDVFTYNDHIRFTPQLLYVSGSQKFGFNQSTTTYAQTIQTAANVMYNSENVYLDNKTYFQPLSLTMFLRGEYSIKKFFIQPQLAFDYYFPASSNNFSVLFSFNAGLIF